MSKFRHLFSLMLLLPLSFVSAQIETFPVDTLFVDSVIIDTLVIDPLVVDSVPVAPHESQVKKLLKKRLDQLKENSDIDTIRSFSDVDHMLAVKYQKKGTYDTLYLRRPTNRFTVKLRPRFSGSGFSTSGSWRGHPADCKLSSDMRFAINVNVGYRGYSLGLSFNPFKTSGKSSNTELGFRFYSNKFGFDLSYQNAKSYNGWIKVNGERHDINSDFVTSNIFLATGYYAFNYRRFSYPSVFTQSYIQQRSAGSWLLGASLLAGKLKADKDSEIGNPNMSIQLGYIGIGGGYAYNWVITPQWMVHVSLLPNLVIGSFNKMSVENETERIKFSFPQFLMTERLAVWYNFRHNMFTGMYFVANNTLLANSGDLRLNYRRWRLEISYGIRF